jgi:cell division protein ZapA (FtsZ GTPase activity inhibitor)
LVGKIVFSSGKGDLLTTAYEYITQKQVFFITIIFPMLIIAAILLKRGISSLSREISSIKQELAELEAKREQSNENKFDNSKNNDEKWR